MEQDVSELHCRLERHHDTTYCIDLKKNKKPWKDFARREDDTCWTFLS